MQARNAKPEDKPYKMPVGKGLYLLVAPSGTKTWIYRYELPPGKERTATLGIYGQEDGQLTFEEAQKKRFWARDLVKQGINVTEYQKRQKQEELAAEQAKQEAQAILANTFAVVARDWHERQNSKLTAKTQRLKWGMMKNHILPRLGDRPIAYLKRKELVEAVLAIESEISSCTAGNAACYISSVFTYAQNMGHIEADPATNLKSVLKKHTTKHMKMLHREEMPKLLQLLKLNPEANPWLRRKGNPSEMTKAAMLFTILTSARTNEVRLAEWKEIDFEKSLWRRPGEHMKMRKVHTVALSRQAVDVLKIVAQWSKGYDRIFTTSKGLPIGSSTLTHLLKDSFKMEATVHGFRAFFLSEAKRFGVFYERAIGAALSHHKETGFQSDSSYDRNDYLELRIPIMQWYGDWLEAMQKSGKLEPSEDYLPPRVAS